MGVKSAVLTSRTVAKTGDQYATNLLCLASAGVAAITAAAV
jgi:hypothetical protein